MIKTDHLTKENYPDIVFHSKALPPYVFSYHKSYTKYQHSEDTLDSTVTPKAIFALALNNLTSVSENYEVSNQLNKQVNNATKVAEEKAQKETEAAEEEEEEKEEDENEKTAQAEQSLNEDLETDLDIPTDATAAGEEPENEGGQPLMLDFDFGEADVFGDEFDLGLDDDDGATVVVFFDEKLITEFFLEQIADDRNVSFPGNVNLTNPDVFMSFGNTLLDVGSGGMLNNFRSMSTNWFSETSINGIAQNNPLLIGPRLFLTGSVLDNDEATKMTVLSVLNVTAGAIVEMNPDGTFKYVPPPGLKNQTDTFHYVMQDGDGQTYIGDVSIQVNNRIWYVDNSAGGVDMTPLPNSAPIVTVATNLIHGSGTSVDPFSSLDAFIGPDRPDAPGDYIFIRTGAAPYDSGLALLAGQKLIGEGSDLIVDGFHLWSATRAPILTNSNRLVENGTSVILNDQNIVSGLNIQNTIGTGIDINNASKALLHMVNINNTGEVGIHIDGTSQTLVFHSLNFNNMMDSAIDFHANNQNMNLFLINNQFGSNALMPTIQGQLTNGSLVHLFANNNIIDNSELNIPAINLNDDGTSGLNLAILNNTVNTAPVDFQFSDFGLIQIEPFGSRSTNPSDVLADLNNNTAQGDVSFISSPAQLAMLGPSFIALPNLEQDFIDTELSVFA